MRKFTDSLVRVESLWSLGNLIWTALVAGGGVIMTLLSQANDYVSQHGVFGYGVVFLVSCLMISITLYLIASCTVKFRQVRPRGDAARKMAPPSVRGVEARPHEDVLENNLSAFAPDRRNISRTTISNRTIRLHELFDEDDSRLRDVVFEKCTLLGPGVVFFSGGQMNGAQIIGIDNVENALIEVPEKSIILGGFTFENCIFRETRFKLISFAGTNKSLNSIRAVFGKPEKTSILRD